MVPRGLAAAVLAELVITSGITGVEQFPNIVITVILVSVLITTIGIFAILKGFIKPIKSKELFEKINVSLKRNL
jgi:NhaP-type Na+/H+ and K+/H+ antiporter